MDTSDTDHQSLLITTDTDMTMSDLEDQLAVQGLSLNFYGVPHNDYLLAEVLNQRIPNLYGSAFGGIEDLCIQIRLAQPDGSLWENCLTPRSATGPCLKNLAIGSTENMGIPVQAVLRVFPQPECTKLNCVLFSQAANRDLFQQSIYRHHLPVPLKANLEQAQLQAYLEEPVENLYSLGMALWGTHSEVEPLESYLREMAQARKGEFVEITGKDMEDDFVKLLHDQALRDWKNYQEKLLPPLEASHKRLAKMIQEIS